MYLGKVEVAEELVLVLEERAHETRGIGRSRFGRHAGLYRTEHCVFRRRRKLASERESADPSSRHVLTFPRRWYVPVSLGAGVPGMSCFRLKRNTGLSSCVHFDGKK